MIYLNSGDWIENLTALEYNNSIWDLIKYDEKKYTKNHSELTLNKENFKKALNYESLFEEVINGATNLN